MRHFNLIQSNVPHNDEPTVETEVLNVWGSTALEVLDTVESYMRSRGDGKFDRVSKMVWSNGFNTQITLVEF